MPCLCQPALRQSTITDGQGEESRVPHHADTQARGEYLVSILNQWRGFFSSHYIAMVFLSNELCKVWETDFDCKARLTYDASCFLRHHKTHRQKKQKQTNKYICWYG